MSERLEELLCDRALEGLDAGLARELDALMGELGVVDDPTFDLAAAAIDLASLRALEELPAALSRRLVEAADAHFGRARPALKAPPRQSTSWVPWALAAGFAGLSVYAFADRAREAVPTPAPSVATLASSATPPPPRPKTLAEERAELVAAGAKVIPWSPTKDPGAAGATGDVVWSSDAQRGFMRFHGLAKNDPKVTQYQLWIFDAERDDKYPVDGGVFDVEQADGDVIVRITPKIVAKKPKLFAITIEAPGGVVVSKREHIVLTASI